VFLGPQASEAFFRAADSQLSAKEAYQFTVPVFGKGISYDTTPERMNEQLGFLFPALHKQRLQRYAQVMAEEAEAYVEGWGAEGQVDLLNAMNELTLFIASRCLIGPEFRQHLTTEFARLYRDLEGGLNLLAFFNPNLPLPAFRRRDRARLRTVERISQIIVERRARGIEGEDFLQTLMTARYADGSTLSDDNITGLLLTLLFAGQHTSAILATWTGILLLQHPHYLPAILQEQQRVLGDANASSLEDLHQLGHLERGVKEAERMRPPIVILMRKVLQDFTYEGYSIPAGGLAMVSSGVSHRIADVFSNPDRYDPDRFGPGREEDRQATYALLGFGGGAHRCIGKPFAYQQIMILWSVLLRRFDLELVQEHYHPNYSTLLVGPQQPCFVRYRRKLLPAGNGPGPGDKENRL
jgi:sterol 14-demethylase